jgi:hypothetical protein
MSSSDNLHPESGARFAFERTQEEPPQYRLRVYLPDALLESTLAWEGERAHFEPALPDAWAADEAVKLARVLHRTPAIRLVRWRGP